MNGATAGLLVGGVMVAMATTAVVWKQSAGAEGTAAPAARAETAPELLERLRRVEEEAGRRIARLEENVASTQRLAFALQRENEDLRAALDDLLGFSLAGARHDDDHSDAGPEADADTSIASLDPFGLAGPRADGADAPGDFDGIAVPPEREAEVRAVLAKVEEEERIERERRADERRRENAQRQVDRLAEPLNLSPHQSEEMAAAVYERDTRRHQAFQRMRRARGEERAAHRAEAQQATEAYEAALQQILHPMQYEQLEEIRAERRNRRRGGD